MLEIFIALGAGLISFLSPCVLPLIPGYVSFISGFTLDELVKTKKINIISLILFCFGFSLVFIILGASASVIGKFFLYNTNYFRIIAGLIIIIFSLQLLGIINIKYFNFEKKFYTKNQVIILRGMKQTIFLKKLVLHRIICYTEFIVNAYLQVLSPTMA